MIELASADKWSVGKRLRIERERLGFTAGGLAKTAGIRAGVHDAWERGKDWPHLIELNSYARLGLDVSFVVTGVRALPIVAEGANAVDLLRERVGAASDSALARMLNVSTSAVSRWRSRNLVPTSATLTPDRAAPLSLTDLRKAIGLLPANDRRALVLELMAGELGG